METRILGYPDKSTIHQLMYSPGGGVFTDTEVVSPFSNAEGNFTIVVAVVAFSEEDPEATGDRR